VGGPVARHVPDQHLPSGSAVRPPANEAVALRRNCAEVVPGWWFGGEQATVPAGVGVVITLDAATLPVATPGVVELRHPFRDSRWQPVPRATVVLAVAAVVEADAPLFVRCRFGLNRSALVTGLALRRCGWRATEVVQRLREAQPGALTNPYFADLLATYPTPPEREGAFPQAQTTIPTEEVA
jgi:hypothetical protein